MARNILSFIVMDGGRPMGPAFVGQIVNLRRITPRCSSGSARTSRTTFWYRMCGGVARFESVRGAVRATGGKGDRRVLRLLAARHALLAAAAQGIGVVPLPVDTARVARPLHGVTPGTFRFQHVIGDGGRVDICGPGSHTRTSAISISLRSNWLTKSLSETPLRIEMAKRRPCSSGSR